MKRASLPVTQSPPFITDDKTHISDHRTVGPIVASTIANLAIVNGTTSSEDDSDGTTSSFQISRRHKRRLSRLRKKKNELLAREQALLQSDNKVPVTVPMERSHANQTINTRWLITA